MPKRIAFLIFPQFQLLDAAGPMAAFEVAARLSPGTYDLRVIAQKAGSVKSSAWVGMEARGFSAARAVDTLIVVGGFGSREASKSMSLLQFVRAQAKKARRVASVCSGAYVLAAAGLLDGRTATTHWSRSQDFARKFPRVRLDADRIYVKAGKYWSSAGITAGIDLALAMIAEDLGESVARKCAQQLVVYYRRPGGQSQFSALLDLERADGRFAPLLDYIRSHLRERLSVEDLATRACMSARNFSRAFQAETGTSPAKAVARLRAEVARARLESGGVSVQEVASACGFQDPERMRRCFIRLFGMPPSSLRAR